MWVKPDCASASAPACRTGASAVLRRLRGLCCRAVRGLPDLRSDAVVMRARPYRISYILSVLRCRAYVVEPISFLVCFTAEIEET
eukprot:6174641-Pleurochrysis_carterae.AAC.1